MPDVRQTGKQRAPPLSAVSQLPSASQNSYANVAFLGVAYSDPLQRPSFTFEMTKLLLLCKISFPPLAPTHTVAPGASKPPETEDHG